MFKRPFFKFFNVNLLALEAGINNQKVYRNLNNDYNENSLTEEEKERFIEKLEDPTREMFRAFGKEIEIKSPENIL